MLLPIEPGEGRRRRRRRRRNLYSKLTHNERSAVTPYCIPVGDSPLGGGGRVGKAYSQ